MRHLTAFAAGLCLLSLSCFLFNKTPISPTVPDGGFADATPGQTFVDCSDKVIHDAWVGLIPAVETGLATGNVEGALAAVGINIAAPGVIGEVTCAVQYLVNKYLAEKPLYKADDLTALKVINGQRWLSSHNIQTTNVPQ